MAASAFTLVELLIVLAIIMAILAPMTALYLLPIRTQAQLSEITRTSQAHRNLVDHLSEDVRIADSIELTGKGNEPETLAAGVLIHQGSTEIEYAGNEKGDVVRRVLGKVPLEFTFNHVRAGFSLDTDGFYQSLRASFTSRYELLRNTIERQEQRVFCSHLEGRP